MSRLRQFIASNVYANIFRSPHWKIGWRRVEGTDVWDTQTLNGTRWNLLTDPRNRFFADPITTGSISEPRPPRRNKPRGVASATAAILTR